MRGMWNLHILAYLYFDSRDRRQAFLEHIVGFDEFSLLLADS